MGMNMVTTVMAFSVSAFFVLFVFTRLLCARLHLSRAAADRAAAGDAFAVNVRRSPDPPAVLSIHPSILPRSLIATVHQGGVLDEDECESESFFFLCVWPCRWSAASTAWSRPW